MSYTIKDAEYTKGNITHKGNLTIRNYQLTFEDEMDRKTINFSSMLVWYVKCEMDPAEKHLKTDRNKFLINIHTVEFSYLKLFFNNDNTFNDTLNILKLSCCFNKTEDLPAIDYFLKNPLQLVGNSFTYKYNDYLSKFPLDGWRRCELNHNFEFCKTYPQYFYVPNNVNDTTLTHAKKFRSQNRLPILSYIHYNKMSITRCSQPLVGIKQARNAQDEKLIEAIFKSHLNTKQKEETVDNKTQTKNIIVDARPAANALANKAIGGGSEYAEDYKKCGLYDKIYLNIENIHVIRDNFNKLCEEISKSRRGNVIRKLQDSSSGCSWLNHLQKILNGVNVIVDNIEDNKAHVVVHCSDGWDRTAQLTSLSMICLNKEFRTLEGFASLIMREFVQAGHRFNTRCAHLNKSTHFVDNSSLKKSHRNNSDILPIEDNTSDSAYSIFGQTLNGANQLFNNMQDKIYYNYYKSEPKQHKESSLIFLQFLDCVYQLFVQYPTQFQFNEQLLIFLHLNSFSCIYDTFLFDNEKDKAEFMNKNNRKMFSVWDYVKKFETRFVNTAYEHNSLPTVIRPKTENVKFWTWLYCGVNYQLDVFTNLDNKADYKQDSEITVNSITNDVLMKKQPQSLFKEVPELSHPLQQ